MTRPALHLFYEHFGRLARQMLEAHSLHRTPTNIGTARELFIASFLDRHLPRSLSVGRGEIIDSQGNRSGDCDVVVYRSTAPTIPSDPGETLHLFFAEGVEAVLEVKSSLTGEELDGAIRACRRIKSLRTGNRPDGEPGFPDIAIVPRGYNPEPLSWIRYFVVAFEALSDQSILERLRAVHEDSAADYYRYGIDGICTLDRSYIYKNDGLIWPSDTPQAANAPGPLVRITDDLLALFLHLVTPSTFTVHKSAYYSDYLQRGAGDRPGGEDAPGLAQ